jgi:DHA2 family multidrug resistance protein
VFSGMMYFSAPQSGFRDFDIPHLFRGMTNGLILTPIAVLSLSGLKGNDIAQSAGLTNMIRQLGGAFGVAIMTIFLSERNPLHRIDLIGHISEYNPLAQERASMITQQLINKGMAADDAGKAVTKVLDIVVNKQAAVLSFNEAFFFAGLIFVAAMPLIFMIKSPKGPANISAH